MKLEANGKFTISYKAKLELSLNIVSFKTTPTLSASAFA